MNSATLSSDYFNEFGRGFLPEHLGIAITQLGDKRVTAEFLVRKALLAPNGYLHAGSIVTLADTAAGYGCIANLPEGATGFTTLELKTNHLGTAREGVVQCIAKATHLGKTTHVWDAVVTSNETGKTIALFRCTQMILYPK
ncbi:MAG: PaaI family thioesterase [Salinisphaera sp.]|jgi:1,4-dihydroxy-2-naphthoyl-CoA hydrolase|nr:PaaI family thioesterase [Salinisphaera sp.]